MPEYLLEMQGVTKTFPGVKALDNVELQAFYKKYNAWMSHAPVHTSANAVLLPQQ